MASPVSKPAKHSKGNSQLWQPALLAMLVVTQIAALFILSRQPKFEYRIESPNDSAFDSEMNGYGSQGWELVSARRATSSNGGPASYEVILRRAK
jgi:hypothetical protein